jgi:predicted  nucleic acid-binding Zn-ribbon protein
MSGMYSGELEMIGWEKEKWNELLSNVKPQIEMIKSQVKLIAVELQKMRENYSLEFDCDMQNYLDNLIFENL